MGDSTPRGTILPNYEFDAEAACLDLNKAMKGLGTDEETIIDILTSCSNRQRQQIKLQYKTMYGKEIEEKLHKELGGKLEDIVDMLMTPIADTYAKLVNDSVNGLGTKESLLLEVLVALNGPQLAAVKEAYKRIYENEMEDDIKSDVSGDFQHFLVGLIAGGRSQDTEVDPEKAEADAQALYDAGVGKFFGTEESEFYRIFNTRSFEQLRETFVVYEGIADEPIRKSVKKEFGGDLEDALVDFVTAVEYLPEYFAVKLRKSMKGAGTKDKELIRILVCRSEFDLQDIKECYEEMYERSLRKDIKGDTSGDYEKILLRIIGE